MLLGLLLVSSCSNEEDSIGGYKTKQLQPKNSIAGFKIEGNSIRINSIEDLPALREALSKIPLDITVKAPNSGKIIANKKELKKLERMSPSEGGSESAGGLPILTCTLYARPVYAYKGDPNVYMETIVTIDGPSVYQKRGWMVTKNIATWRDRNTKVDYTVGGILYVTYQVNCKSPTTHMDTVIFEPMKKEIQESGTYII